MTKFGELFASSLAMMYDATNNIFYQAVNLFSSFSIITWNLATNKLSEVGTNVMEDVDSGWQASAGWVNTAWMSTSGNTNVL